jgi:hypothetical protein
LVIKLYHGDHVAPLHVFFTLVVTDHDDWRFLKLSKRRSLQSLCRHEAHCSISHFDNVSTTRFGSFVPPQLNASKKRWFSSCPQDHVHEDHAHIMEALKDAPGVQAGEGEKFVMVYTCTGGS